MPSKKSGDKPQSTSPGEGALAAELAMLFSKAGLDVPADRMPAMIAGYRDLKEMCALVRQPRTAASEPANVFSLETITRSA